MSTGLLLYTPFMEFFGFACGISPTGPNFPLLPESVLKDYPVEFMGHPAVPSIQFFPYDFMHMDLSSLYQECMDCYLAALQNPLARNIGTGIIAAAVIYYSWKVNFCWNSDLNSTPSGVDIAATVKGREGKIMKVPSNSKLKDIAEHASKDFPRDSTSAVICVSQTTIVEIDQCVSVSETFQRQLIDALYKLDDVRLRLKELESQKELLAAEIDLRKKIAQKLQAENSSERDKRQQAELKMEMMEIENCQLRHLRKELAVKTSQVEKLEKFIKQKEHVQTKLFEDNVVLPRAIAETRAREFLTLQTRIQHLEAEFDASSRPLESGVGHQPTKSVSSFYFTDGSVPLFSPIICDTPAQEKNGLNETTGTASDSSSNGRGSYVRKKLTERAPIINRSPTKLLSPKISRSKTSPCLTTPKKTPSEKPENIEEACRQSNDNPTEQYEEPDRTGTVKSGNVTNQCGSNSNKGHSVFAQIRALISGFRKSSSESDCPCQLEVPAIHIQIQPTQSTDVERSNDKNSDYPLSDEQSSIFMSASGGSDSSDTDQRTDPAVTNSKSLNKKTLHAKRLSKYKRDRCRNKDKSSKRRLPAPVPSRQLLLISPGNVQGPLSDSSDWSHRSTLKNFPVEAASRSNSQIYRKCSGDSQEVDSTPNSSDEDDEVDSGDSWIVIVPSAS